MEKNADLMIFRHENNLRLLEFTYLCKREVKWTLSQTFERLEITHKHVEMSNCIFLLVPFNAYRADSEDYINVAWASD